MFLHPVYQCFSQSLVRPKKLFICQNYQPFSNRQKRCHLGCPSVHPVLYRHPNRECDQLLSWVFLARPRRRVAHQCPPQFYDRLALHDHQRHCHSHAPHCCCHCHCRSRSLGVLVLALIFHVFISTNGIYYRTHARSHKNTAHYRCQREDQMHGHFVGIAEKFLDAYPRKIATVFDQLPHHVHQV